MKREERVIDKLLARCEAAFLAKTPILYICSDEAEIIYEIVASDRLVTRIMRDPESAKGEAVYIPCAAYEARGGITDRIINYGEGLAAVRMLSGLSSAAEQSEGQIGSRSTTGPKLPRLVVARMQASSAEAQFSELATYVDRYINETDDNSALRSSVAILYGSQIVLPQNLQPYAEFIDVDLPEQEEIAEIVTEMMQLFAVAAFEDQRDADDLISLLKGFSCTQIRKLLRRILSADEKHGLNCIYDPDLVLEIIGNAKKQVLKQGQVLELVKEKERSVYGRDTGQSEIGGMERFWGYIQQQKESILRAGRLHENGISCPKGVLLCGVPGSGKSLAAESTAAELRIPLLKLDVGRLMGRYVGESEQNLYLALKQAEAMAPCVLWIDELDKGFSGAGSDSSSDGAMAFKRMFGMLLGWMQSNEKPCFIFATANSIAGMPKEFFRSGRFDALFSMFMPTFEECVEILRKRMEIAARKAGDDSGDLFNEFCYDSKILEGIIADFVSANSRRKRFVTGADLQKLVNSALSLIYQNTVSGAVRVPGEQLREITPEQWKQAVRRVMDEITVYGEGAENLDSIAVCYIRLLRNNFRPAAQKVLFEQYSVRNDEEGKIIVDFGQRSDVQLSSWPTYDRELYRTLLQRMEELAPQLEEIERARLLH